MVAAIKHTTSSIGGAVAICAIVNPTSNTAENSIGKESNPNIDKICSMYGIPVNCTDREQYLSSLFDAATTYEALEKKETDYELLCQLNNSDKIKNQITENIKAMSGLTVVDENNFEDVLDKLASQLK